MTKTPFAAVLAALTVFALWTPTLAAPAEAATPAAVTIAVLA